MTSAPRSTRRDFNFRAMTTFVVTVSFLIMAVSGVMLYLAPRGRVANWTHWSALGLDKEQWADVHMTAAVLMLLAIAVHLYFNWKPLCHYLKSKATAHGVRLRELAVACAVGLVVVGGTLAGLPPFSTVLTVNERIKDAWEPTAGSVGRAPSTYVQEATVSQFAERMGLSLEQVHEALRAHGIVTDDADASIDVLARQHGVSLQSIYETAAAAGHGERPRAGPAIRAERGGGGGRFGGMTLGEFCRAESVPLTDAVRALHDEGVEATDPSRLRDLADGLDMTPRELAEWLARNR